MAGHVTSPGKRNVGSRKAVFGEIAAKFATAWNSRPLSPASRRTAYLQIERGLHAGIPLRTHLERMALASRGRLRESLLSMVEVLDSGGQFYEAAFKATRLFPSPAPALLCAAERTGKVPASLAFMAESLMFDIGVARRIRMALAYPTLLVAASAFVLPLPRLFSCGSSGYLKAAISTMIPFAVVALAAATLRAAALLPRPGRVLNTIADNMPLVGSVRRIKALATTLDTLGQSLSAGIGLFESLTIARTAAGHAEMTRLCDLALSSVRDGGNLAASFGVDRRIPDEIAVTIATGEQTGELPEALEGAARQLREKYASRVTLMVRLLGTAIFSAVMIYAAISIIGAFSQLMGIGGGGFDKEIQKEIPGLFQSL